MAQSVVKKARIQGVNPDPLHPGRVLITIVLADSKGEYQRTYSLVRPERPISLEELSVSIAALGVARQPDPLMHINQAKQSGEEFEIKLTDRLSSMAHSEGMDINDPSQIQ